ncbi:MAG: sugar ABC transporter permease [Firmicutes bacterium]|nr:sugar ABC transporter permease [Bacillota bacterium]
MKKKKYLSGYLLIAPVTLGCLLFYGIPFGMVVSYSFKSSPGRMGRFVGLLNYENVLGNELFRLACWNTFCFFLVGLPLSLLIAYGIALLLKGQAQRHEILKSVLLLPYVMPVAGAVLLVEQIFGKNGKLNLLLDAFGLSPSNWLESSWAFVIVLLLYLWKNVGYGVILLLAGLMTIPKEQYAVSELDGAGSWQKFWHITTPQMWNPVFFALLFAMINGFKCFREIFLIGGEHPGKELYMMQHFINNNFENLNYGKLSVASVLLFAAITVVIGFSYAWVQKKEGYKE